MSDAEKNAEEKAAREQAKKDIEKMIEGIHKSIEDEIQANKEAAKHAQQGQKITTETSSTYGGADMLSREEMADLAKQAGDPYSADELAANVDEINRKYNSEHREQLSNIPELGSKLTNLEDKLKGLQPLANWRDKLKKHFRDAMKGDTEMTRSKRTLSQKWRADRANPYKEKDIMQNLGANIFYLMDNSGSMYYYGGDNIFYQIFKDIITIEKQCKVLTSARAYFADRQLTEKDVEMWDIKTPTSKILELLGDRGSSGGTDIPGNVVAVTKLKKPYYYNTGDRHTTLLVFTDGDNNSIKDWALLKNIPHKILKDVVFVLINTKNNILRYMTEIMKYGVPLKNILGINTEEYKQK